MSVSLANKLSAATQSKLLKPRQVRELRGELCANHFKLAQAVGQRLAGGQGGARPHAEMLQPRQLAELPIWVAAVINQPLQAGGQDCA